MTRIADLEVILADTGPFCCLAEAGEDHLDIAATYIRENVQVVMDVHREIRRRATIPKHARLNRLSLLKIPEREPITITDRSVLAGIEEIVEGRRRRRGGHPDEDRARLPLRLWQPRRSYPR